MDKRFSTLSIEFDTLRTELESSNDPALRRCLLAEIYAKLGEMDELVRLGLPDLSSEPGAR